MKLNIIFYPSSLSYKLQLVLLLLRLAFRKRWTKVLFILIIIVSQTEVNIHPWWRLMCMSRVFSPCAYNHLFPSATTPQQQNQRAFIWMSLFFVASSLTDSTNEWIVVGNNMWFYTSEGQTWANFLQGTEARERETRSHLTKCDKEKK